MSVALLFGIFFFLVILGTPIAICLGASTFVTLMVFTDISPIEISAMIFEKIEDTNSNVSGAYDLFVDRIMDDAQEIKLSTLKKIYNEIRN